MKTRRDLLPDSCSKCRFVEWKLDEKQYVCYCILLDEIINSVKYQNSRQLNCPLEMNNMKLYSVYRNDNVALYAYESAIVYAESPEAAVELLKDYVDKNVLAHNDEVWGNFDVTVEEIPLDRPKIIVQAYRVS